MLYWIIFCCGLTVSFDSFPRKSGELCMTVPPRAAVEDHVSLLDSFPAQPVKNIPYQEPPSPRTLPGPESTADVRCISTPSRRSRVVITFFRITPISPVLSTERGVLFGGKSTATKKRKAVWEETAEADRNLELSHGSGGGQKVRERENYMGIPFALYRVFFRFNCFFGC